LKICSLVKIIPLIIHPGLVTVIVKIAHFNDKSDLISYLMSSSKGRVPVITDSGALLLFKFI